MEHENAITKTRSKRNCVETHGRASLRRVIRDFRDFAVTFL
jgi:hypothetical protein